MPARRCGDWHRRVAFLHCQTPVSVVSVDGLREQREERSKMTKEKCDPQQMDGSSLPPFPAFSWPITISPLFGTWRTPPRRRVLEFWKQKVPTGQRHRKVQGGRQTDGRGRTGRRGRGPGATSWRACGMTFGSHPRSRPSAAPACCSSPSTHRVGARRAAPSGRRVVPKPCLICWGVFITAAASAALLWRDASLRS